MTSGRQRGDRRRIRLGELTREELRSRLPGATVVLPTGSTEQHGRHLPFLTDSLMVEAVALRAVELAAVEDGTRAVDAIVRATADFLLE